MADNYLERQRAQYETRKAAWERSKKQHKKKSKNNSSKANVSDFSDIQRGYQDGE